jgi:hypothetical protein
MTNGQRPMNVVIYVEVSFMDLNLNNRENLKYKIFNLKY